MLLSWPSRVLLEHERTEWDLDTLRHVLVTPKVEPPFGPGRWQSAE